MAKQMTESLSPTREAETIPVIGPSLNLGTSPEKLTRGEFWRLSGTDGRFTHTARRFPGFVEMPYSVSTDARSRPTAYDITASPHYYLFKTVAIQKADTDYILRGWVIGIDDPDNPGEVLLVFLHFDTQENRWFTFKIAPTAGLHTYGVQDTIDVAVAARHLMVSVRNKETKIVLWRYSYDPNDPPNTGDLLCLPAGGTTTQGVGTIGSGGAQPTGSSGTGGRIVTPSGGGTSYVQVGFRWYAPERNLWSDIQLQSVLMPPTTAGYIPCTIYASAVKSFLALGYKKLYAYRSVVNAGVLHLEQIVNFNVDNDGDAVSNGNANDVVAGANKWTTAMTLRLGHDVSAHAPGVAAPVWSLGLNDTAILYTRNYDPFTDESKPAPAGGLMTAYKDMIVMQSPPTTNTLYGSGGVQWSTLFNYTPENFPVADHIYSPSALGHRVLALKEAGEYAFAIRDDSTVRLARNGPVMAINELYRKIGGVGRYAVESFGQFLLMVSPIGAIQVDGTSGKQDVVGALERLIVDPVHWAGTLASIHMAFDGELGAMALLNTAKEEVCWLWIGNGTPTFLNDAPFIYVTTGPHPISGGNDRTWWLSPTGRIFHVNYDRSAPRQTMCGGAAWHTVNGIADVTDPEVTDPTTMFVFKTFDGSQAILPSCEGFYLYFTSGTLRKTRRKIVSVTTTAAGGALVTLSEPTPTPITTQRVSVAPIPFLLGFHPIGQAKSWDAFGRLPSQSRSWDAFGRFVGHTVAASVRLHAGEVNTRTNPGLKLTLQLFRDPSWRPVETDSDMHPDAARLEGVTPVVGESLFPGVEQFSSDVDFELRAIQVTYTIDEETAPTS